MMFVYRSVGSLIDDMQPVWYPPLMANILLVEDDDSLAKVIEEILKIHGHSVVRAKNGIEAIRQYNAGSIDLVLTDIVMPDMEGLELIHKLHRTAPQIKIVAMSGGGLNNAPIYLSIAKNFGAIEVLAKPFSGDELIASIQAALAG